ncbi:2151_t:CDS:2, partial [Gigaspora rosea]
QPLVTDNKSTEEPSYVSDREGNNKNESDNEEILIKTLSKTEQARYTAVLYYFQLLLKDKEKMEASKTVTGVVNRGPWLAKCIRKWANLCMRGELIEPNFRGKLPSRSLLHDELVSLQLGAYLRSQKFEDVVAYRQIFLEDVAQLNQFMFKWLDQNSYDGPHAVWSSEGEQLLRKKGLGSSIHISNFLVETIGPLKDDQDEPRSMMVLGTN